MALSKIPFFFHETLLCVGFCKYYSSLINLLTPRNRVFLEKLTGSQLVKKFPAIYGTGMFITTFTSARRLSLSCARSIHITLPEDPS